MEHAVWTEKYRPKTFEEVIGQDSIVRKLKAFVQENNMPHVLFAGPAGIGKTTLALVIAKQLFKEEWHNNFLELNASDERGIDVIRVKVKDFARTKSIGNVPFKIIYLDECDALTREAQQALRRTMENYTNTTRFILSCNYSSKIIDPIQSRCSIFKFKPLSREAMEKLIRHIAEQENLKLDEKTINAIIDASRGDVRRAENLMQSSSVIDKHITEETVYEMASMAKPREVKKILEHCIAKEYEKAKDLGLKTMLNYSLNGIDLIKQFQQSIWNLEIEGKQKLEMIKLCGEAEFRLIEGSDEHIQVEALLANFTLIPYSYP